MNVRDAVLHEGFHQNAEHLRGNAFDLLASEGASKKVVKVFGEVWRTFFQKGSPRKNSKVFPRKTKEQKNKKSKTEGEYEHEQSED